MVMSTMESETSLVEEELDADDEEVIIPLDEVIGDAEAKYGPMPAFLRALLVPALTMVTSTSPKSPATKSKPECNPESTTDSTTGMPPTSITDCTSKTTRTVILTSESFSGVVPSEVLVMSGTTSETMRLHDEVSSTTKRNDQGEDRLKFDSDFDKDVALISKKTGVVSILSSDVDSEGFLLDDDASKGELKYDSDDDDDKENNNVLENESGEGISLDDISLIPSSFNDDADDVVVVVDTENENVNVNNGTTYHIDDKVYGNDPDKVNGDVKEKDNYKVNSVIVNKPNIDVHDVIDVQNATDAVIFALAENDEGQSGKTNDGNVGNVSLIEENEQRIEVSKASADATMFDINDKDDDVERDARRSPDSGCSMSEVSADDVEGISIESSASASSDDVGSSSKLDEQIRLLKLAMTELREQDVALARQLLVVYEYVEETKWFLENFELCDVARRSVVGQSATMPASMSPMERRFSQNMHKRMSAEVGGTSYLRGFNAGSCSSSPGSPHRHRPAWMELNNANSALASRSKKCHSRNISDGSLEQLKQIYLFEEDSNNSGSSPHGSASTTSTAATSNSVELCGQEHGHDRPRRSPKMLATRSFSSSCLEVGHSLATMNEVVVDARVQPLSYTLPPSVDKGKTRGDRVDSVGNGAETLEDMSVPFLNGQCDVDSAVREGDTPSPTIVSKNINPKLPAEVTNNNHRTGTYDETITHENEIFNGLQSPEMSHNIYRTGDDNKEIISQVSDSVDESLSADVPHTVLTNNDEETIAAIVTATEQTSNSNASTPKHYRGHPSSASSSSSSSYHSCISSTSSSSTDSTSIAAKVNHSSPSRIISPDTAHLTSTSSFTSYHSCSSSTMYSSTESTCAVVNHASPIREIIPDTQIPITSTPSSFDPIDECEIYVVDEEYDDDDDDDDEYSIPLQIPMSPFGSWLQEQDETLL